MSIKLKIILFISILIILSLGITLFYLSYVQYKPSLKDEIIQRIDYQLNYLTPDVFRVMRGDLSYDMLDIPTFRILDENTEVFYLVIFKGKRKNRLRYFWIIRKNKIVYKLKNGEEEITYFNEVLNKLKWKRFISTDNIIDFATSKTNNIQATKGLLYCSLDLKQFFQAEEERYRTAISNINSIVAEIEKKENKKSKRRFKKFRHPKINKKALRIVNSVLATTNFYEKRINKILKKIKDKPKIKTIYNSSKAIVNIDLKKLREVVFLDTKMKLKKKLEYSSEIQILKSVTKILKAIHSRIVFINKLFNEIDALYEVTYDFSRQKKKDKNLSPVETFKLLKFYKLVERNFQIYGVYEVGISVDEIMKKINPIIRQGIKSSLVILILSILAALLLSLYIIFPIHILDKGADEILKDLKYRIRLKRKDEFGKFAKTFNNLANQLTEELSKYQKLYKEATQDALTKLMVRRYFMETLKRELENAKKDKRPTSLLITDIDHFKKFNDTYGHQTGDIVLAKVAEVLLRYTRRNRVRNDVAGRYGGEEFVVLLPDTNKNDALKVAERIRREVENMKIKSTKGKNLKVTISIGVATSEDSTIEPNKLIERADKALYNSKETGRNRVSYG